MCGWQKRESQRTSRIGYLTACKSLSAWISKVQATSQRLLVGAVSQLGHDVRRIDVNNAGCAMTRVKRMITLWWMGRNLTATGYLLVTPSPTSHHISTTPNFPAAQSSCLQNDGLLCMCEEVHMRMQKIVKQAMIPSDCGDLYHLIAVPSATGAPNWYSVLLPEHRDSLPCCFTFEKRFWASHCLTNASWISKKHWSPDLSCFFTVPLSRNLLIFCPVLRPTISDQGCGACNEQSKGDLCVLYCETLVTRSCQPGVVIAFIRCQRSPGPRSPTLNVRSSCYWGSSRGLIDCHNWRHGCGTEIALQRPAWSPDILYSQMVILWVPARRTVPSKMQAVQGCEAV